MRSLRAWAPFLGAAVLASLLTPNGVQGFLFPVALIQMKANAFIQEWRGVDLLQAPPVLLVALCALYLGLARGFRLAPVRLLLIAGLLQTGMEHARNQLLTGVIGLLVVAEPLGRHLRGTVSCAASSVPRPRAGLVGPPRSVRL